MKLNYILVHYHAMLFSIIFPQHFVVCIYVQYLPIDPRVLGLLDCGTHHIIVMLNNVNHIDILYMKSM